MKRNWRISPVFLALAAVMVTGCSHSIEELEVDLREGNWSERMSAVDEFADRGLVGYAALGLADDDSRVRNTAVNRLSQMGDDAVGPILDLLQNYPEDVTTLAAAVEVLENLGARALEGVLEAVWRGTGNEAEMGYLIIRRVRDAEYELERMLSEPEVAVRLLRSELPRVRVSVLADLVTYDAEYLTVLLDLFSGDRARQYMLAATLEDPPDPLPGMDGFGPLEGGTNVLNNFTALSLSLFIHRHRLMAAAEDEGLRGEMEGSEEPVYMSFYDEAPWRPFYRNCVRAAERAKERGGPIEGVTLDQLEELLGELSTDYHAVSEAHFDFEASARLLKRSKEFAVLRGEIAELASETDE